QPVRPLDGIVHVPLPGILAHVAERGGDAALRRHGVRAGRKDLGDAGDLQPLLGGAERGAQTRAARADDDDVVFVIDEFVSSHGRDQAPKPAGSGAEPSASRTMKKTLAAASTRHTRFSSTTSAA